MSAPTTRRRFLRLLGLASGAALAPGALEALCARVAVGANLRAGGYGPLARDPGRLIDLPAGFTYRALSTAVLGREDDRRFSHKLTSGEPVPAFHDGMAAFPGPRGLTILVRNHELTPGDHPAVPGLPKYDALGTGGTTTLWVDGDRRLVRSFPSLAGTFRNCAGGATPWGSWLSAEECTYMPGPRESASADQRPDVRERHGYIFEVDSRAEGPVDPVPIRAMGRFCHEAAAVDPVTGFAYLTEDRSDGLLYRYRPDVIARGIRRPKEMRVGDFARGGVLEAMKIVGRPGAGTQNWQSPTHFTLGRSFGVGWVRISEVDPDLDMERDPSDLNPIVSLRSSRTAENSTRAQGFRLGAAQFARMEGITLRRRALYFCATDGGRTRRGQVWRLDLAAGTLTLVVEPNDGSLLDGPDNLVSAPNGDLVVCEDGGGENFVLGITPRGTIYRFARNAHNNSEFAGATFAPDGRTLFVNVQDPGITFAIRGPWTRRQA